MKYMNLPDLKEARKRTGSKTVIKYDGYNIDSKYEDMGKGKTYHILTYGCQMNVHDSENISAIMEELGYKKNDDMETSDVIILNTCAIRENAHNKVTGMLGRIKHLKEEKSDIVTVLCGCMAQEEGICNLLKDKYKWVNVVMGTHNINKLPEYLYNSINNNELEMEVFSCEGEVIENLPVKRDSKYKAWVNIMYGCDKFCTYCIVPYTRGKQRSRMPEDIIKEVEELVNNGYKEVTLLGQNVNAYGKDLGINYDMSDLLLDVSKTNIDRIRFVTSHPWDFTDKMIEVIAKCDNIMPYIHLPIQSGSNEILKKMGRRYTVEEYKTLFNKIKEYMPNASISTDIIVGFPGETEKDFNDTLDIVNELKFDLAYTFIYSKREGTPASKMEDNVSEEEKKNRLHKLNELVNKYAKENNMKYLGKTVKVLLEDKSEKDGYLMGYTDTMKLVNVKADDSYIGSIMDVKIVDVKTWSLDGELENV